MIRPTLELGNPTLRQVSAPIADPLADDVKALIQDLRDTLQDWRARHGWGHALGAPVIGVPRRIIVIESGDTSMVLINPTFESWGNEQVDAYETCITFPALWGCVFRPRTVVVQAFDEAGAPCRIEATDDLARILQHEIDHLDGFIWLDREPDTDTICTTAEYRRRSGG
jgi:peptide deformylase